MTDTIDTPPAVHDIPPAPSARALAPAPDKEVSRWEDFIDIFYAPSAVFARRATAGFGIPMLVVTLLGAVIFFASYNAMSPMLDAEFSRSAAAALRKGVTPEMMEKGRAVSEKLVKVAIFVAPPIVMFVTGLALALCGRLVGGAIPVGTAVMVASYANVPRLVGALLSAVQALLLDPSALTGRHKVALDAARYMDPDTASPLLVALAGRIDVFTIWATILLGIGLSVIARISRSQAFVAAFLVWLLGALPDVLGALRQ